MGWRAHVAFCVTNEKLKLSLPSACSPGLTKSSPALSAFSTTPQGMESWLLSHILLAQVKGGLKDAEAL